MAAAAYATGRRLLAQGVAEELAADVQSPLQGPDKSIVARAMETAFQALRGCCARYLASGRREACNALPATGGQYVLRLSMPAAWNCSATPRLAALMHECVTQHCLHAIFERTCPEEAAGALAKAESALAGVKAVLELRTAPVRRPAGRLW